MITAAVPTLPPFAAANATVTPCIGWPSVAFTRATIGCASSAPVIPVWAPPDTSTSAPAFGSTVSNTVSALSFRSIATIRATPREGSEVPAPAPGAVIAARVGSSELHAIGVFAIGAACPSNATAVNVNGSPETTVLPSGEMTTLAAVDPVPVYTTGTSMGGGGGSPLFVGTTTIGNGPPRNTVSPTTFTYARARVIGSPVAGAPKERGTVSETGTTVAAAGNSITRSTTISPRPSRIVTRTRSNGTRSLATPSARPAGPNRALNENPRATSRPASGPVTSRPQLSEAMRPAPSNNPTRRMDDGNGRTP